MIGSHCRSDQLDQTRPTSGRAQSGNLGDPISRLDLIDSGNVALQ